MRGLRSTIAAALFAAACMAGCAREDGPELGTVTGRVTMDGKPLSRVRVVYSLGHSRPSAGITDSDGRYELRYTVSRMGALPGPHTVQFYQLGSAADGGTANGDADDDGDGGGLLVSPEGVVVREVQPGNNVFDFEL